MYLVPVLVLYLYNGIWLPGCASEMLGLIWELYSRRWYLNIITDILLIAYISYSVGYEDEIKQILEKWRYRNTTVVVQEVENQ